MKLETTTTVRRRQVPLVSLLSTNFRGGGVQMSMLRKDGTNLVVEVEGAEKGRVPAHLLERFASRLGCPFPSRWGPEVLMAGAYSTDLRERVLLAMEGGATPEAVARRFAVGRSTAYRWLEAAREEGRRSAKPMDGGPKPKISGEVEAALRGVLAESNRLSLAECRDRLAERTGVHVHLWTVGRALRRMGWT